ncbi:MAG: hypothetical protein QM594_10700 [Niabella sp.]
MFNSHKQKVYNSKSPCLAFLTILVLWGFFLSADAQRVHRIGSEGASTIFSFYNTSPESPDGKTIAYIRCIEEPSGDGDEILAPAELWVCDRNLQKHRKVTGIKGTAAHNGVEAQWVDNDRIAIFDSFRVRLIDVHIGKDLLKNEIKANGLGHHPFQNKILYNIYKNDGRGEPGIYELDCNTQQSRLILSVADCGKAKLPDYLHEGDVKPVSNWRALHSQYSPDGKKIAFRLDIGSSERSQLLGICNIDGSGLSVMPKSLHFFWYDNISIVGHLQNGKDGKRHEVPEKRFSLTRWDLNGNVLQEMMAPRGNHLAMSPDKKQFVSETFYNTNPVVIKLYTIGAPGFPVTIDSFDPLGVTWVRRFHANPAFSRDGKRVYFSKPLNTKYNGTFYYEID